MKTKIYKKSILTTLMAAVFTTLAFSQTLTQVVRGTIVDVDSKLQLPGATLVISNGITGVREMWGNMPAYVVIPTFGGHIPNRVSIYKAIEAVMASSEHLYGLLEGCISLNNDNPTKSIEEFISRFSEKKFDSLCSV